MKLVAKVLTAMQALLLAPMGAAKANDAMTPGDANESAGWEAAMSEGTPEALQHFISRFPQGEHRGEAFELLVASEIESAVRSRQSLTGVQLAEARNERLEKLEQNFDRKQLNRDLNSDDESKGLTPY